MQFTLEISKILKNKKIFSGSFGDFSLNSFNIMKNISAMYGGSVATNDKDFLNFAKSNPKLQKFSIPTFYKTMFDIFDT